MKTLKFCPNCGNESLLWDGEKKWNCTECSFILFHNVAGAVAVVIRYQDEILFTRRNQEPKLGKLDLPGGFVDPEESAENTCKREVLEELSLEIFIQNLRYSTSYPNIYNYKEIPYHTLDLFYEYEVQEKSIINLDEKEISEAIWIPISEIKLEDIAFESQKLFLAEYQKNNF